MYMYMYIYIRVCMSVCLCMYTSIYTCMQHVYTCTRQLFFVRIFPQGIC